MTPSTLSDRTVFSTFNGAVYLGRLRLDDGLRDGLSNLFFDAFNFASVTGDEASAKAARELGFALEDAEAEARRQVRATPSTETNP